MAVLWQYYLGIAMGTLMIAGFALAKAPIFLVFAAGIWLFYATLRCPDCRTFLRSNRQHRWNFPATTCLKCGRDLTRP